MVAKNGHRLISTKTLAHYLAPTPAVSCPLDLDSPVYHWSRPSVFHCFFEYDIITWPDVGSWLEVKMYKVFHPDSHMLQLPSSFWNNIVSQTHDEGSREEEADCFTFPKLARWLSLLRNSTLRLILLLFQLNHRASPHNFEHRRTLVELSSWMERTQGL